MGEGVTRAESEQSLSTIVRAWALPALVACALGAMVALHLTPPLHRTVFVFTLVIGHLSVVLKMRQLLEWDVSQNRQKLAVGFLMIVFVFGLVLVVFVFALVVIFGFFIIFIFIVIFGRFVVKLCRTGL
eukprot:m.271664 g.271664  ORF g.271664 m.271664 type:complete len:129 (+) comp54785_c0_seq5:127-513(+)